ncbi:hypothetical protein DFH08DRAFT_972124 [Mycena albidolilacea]|uniref:Uncharacterized protein n=1 Tax=Mycena albidolilacea TaxID=1033008 RepID=A0AAD6ZCT4_9AGAR|nr:hypothetical protein DFH08DRAFT_972124 [Mycena albidolilacea]
MPDSETHGSAQGSGGAHVRTATVDDLDELGATTQRAFISSPPQMFFSGATRCVPGFWLAALLDAKRRAQQIYFLKFLIRESWSLEARITVVVVPATDNRDSGKIVAAPISQGPRPPGAKKSGPSLFSALRMCLSSVLINLGVEVMTRISELIQSSEHVLREGYAELKPPGTPDDAWYLQLAGVDPEFQGKEPPDADYAPEKFSSANLAARQLVRMAYSVPGGAGNILGWIGTAEIYGHPFEVVL